MDLSRTTKIVLALVLAIGALVFVVLADFGINAGRIHYGVSIGDVDVGGMTEAEAIEALEAEAAELEDDTIIFTTDGLHCPFVPEDFGWDPLPAENAEAARRIGFRGSAVDALGERLRAWFAGVEVEWDTKARRYWKVTEHIDECAAQAEAIGETVKEKILRRRMLIAIVTTPRRHFQIPLEGDG